MSLSRLQYVAPKKFTSMSKKPQVDLSSVRDMIQKTRASEDVGKKEE